MPYLDWVVEPISFVETFVVALFALLKPCYCLYLLCQDIRYCLVCVVDTLHITPLSPWRGVGGEAIRDWS